MKVDVVIVNAFVDGDKGGNPAGVVLQADTLTDNQKLTIANKVGLSETAFVAQSEFADYKLDFFTPSRQIAHCGHATIGVFSYLSQLGLIENSDTSKETIDGVRKITVNSGVAFMEQLKPTYKLVRSDEPIYTALGVSKSDVFSEPVVVNTGNSFLVIGVNSIDVLNRIKPNQKTISDISEEYDLIGFYVFTTETNNPDRDASTRMFAPRYGIDEEAATGMAAGPLACYLYDHCEIKKDAYVIEQGYSMHVPSPSCIYVELKTASGAGIYTLNAGGVASVSETVQIEI